ncbi:MAG: hypothetical protein A2145_04820 [candidate division Zixibacteria bacterium RBG_16_40_9]|nr:MAG: hypothetical protein A2145_04820 [candidate division Zixibacteria bacterium RBG_16_40_9]
MKGKVEAVCISEKKGVRKKNVGEACLIENFGIENDAHAGNWHRQVSFLASESIEKAKQKWNLKVSFGDFAENIATSGIDLLALQIGERLKIGDKVIIEITQKGKKCHIGCEIMKLTGRCIFPLEGIFGKVIKGGLVKVGQEIEVQPKGQVQIIGKAPKSCRENKFLTNIKSI